MLQLTHLAMLMAPNIFTIVFWATKGWAIAYGMRTCDWNGKRWWMPHNPEDLVMMACMAVEKKLHEDTSIFKS